MSRLYGKLSLNLTGSYHADSFNYPAPTEIYSATGIGTLQVGSAPASGPCSWTVSAGNIVTVSNSASTVQQSPTLFVFGKNNSASASVVSFQSWKNGASASPVYTQTVTAGNFYALSMYFFEGVVAGDYIEMRVWADKTPVIYSFMGIQPEFSRYMPMGKTGRLITNLTTAMAYTTPSFTLLSPGTQVGYFSLTTDDNYVNLNHLLQYQGETYTWRSKVVNGINILILKYGDQTPSYDSYQGSTSAGVYVRMQPKITSTFYYNTSDIFIV